MKIKLLLCAGFALAVAAPAQAQTRAAATGGLQHDAQCLLVMGSLKSNPDQKLQQASFPGLYFYLGQIVAHNPAVDLTTALASAGRSVAALQGDKAQSAAIGNACIQELVTRAQQLQATSQALTKTAPAPATPAQPAR